jgi:tyrosyl-tRNA synthetase
LAWEVVRQYHGEAAANEAREAAKTGGREGTLPEYSVAAIPQFPAKLAFILGATGLCKSTAEGKRKIQEGGVRIDGDKITDADLSFSQPDDLYDKVLQVGKKNFIRLVK